MEQQFNVSVGTQGNVHNSYALWNNKLKTKNHLVLCKNYSFPSSLFPFILYYDLFSAKGLQIEPFVSNLDLCE